MLRLRYAARGLVSASARRRTTSSRCPPLTWMIWRPPCWRWRAGWSAAASSRAPSPPATAPGWMIILIQVKIVPLHYRSVTNEDRRRSSVLSELSLYMWGCPRSWILIIFIILISVFIYNAIMFTLFMGYIE